MLLSNYQSILHINNIRREEGKRTREKKGRRTKGEERIEPQAGRDVCRAHIPMINDDDYRAKTEDLEGLEK